MINKDEVIHELEKLIEQSDDGEYVHIQTTFKVDDIKRTIEALKEELKEEKYLYEKERFKYESI